MKENDDCLISASRREGRGGRVRNGRVGGELWEVRPAAASACSVGATASRLLGVVVGRLAAQSPAGGGGIFVFSKRYMSPLNL